MSIGCLNPAAIILSNSISFPLSNPTYFMKCFIVPTVVLFIPIFNFIGLCNVFVANNSTDDVKVAEVNILLILFTFYFYII